MKLTFRLFEAQLSAMETQSLTYMKPLVFYVMMNLACFEIDIFAIHNYKIGGDESQKAGCRTVDGTPFAP